MSELESAIRKQIKGALKAAINDHGPITKSLIGSVLKRLESQPIYRILLISSEPEVNNTDKHEKRKKVLDELHTALAKRGIILQCQKCKANGFDAPCAYPDQDFKECPMNGFRWLHKDDKGLPTG